MRAIEGVEGEGNGHIQALNGTASETKEMILQQRGHVLKGKGK